MKRLLTLAALMTALGLPPAAQAWEREAFKALKEIKDMASEQAKQEKAEKERAAKEQAERDEQERAAKEQAERDEQERAAREQAAKEQAERDRIERERQEQERAAREEAAKEQAKQDEQERQQAERQKWEQERRKWEQERRQWEQERQQAEQAQADSAPPADPSPPEQADSDPQADTDKAERERAERAGGMSCYGVALFEEAGVIVFSEQEQLKKLKAEIADLKKNCYGDPNEPPADFQERNPALGPRHCHKPMLATHLQEGALSALRDEAADAEIEKKRQAAEKKFDALFLEAAEAGCVEKEAMDAFHADKAERERAARDKAWCEQNDDRRISDMNCFEMEKAYDCREAAWIAAVTLLDEANGKMRKARQTADAADPQSMAEFDRLQAERDAASEQADLAKKRGQEVIYDGVKNNCPTQAWDMHPGFVDEQFAHRLLRLKNRMNR